MSSPVIDADNDSVPQIPPVDLAGGLRIVDGNGDGVEHVDMGALEYRNRAPIANAGDDRIVMAGSACLAAVSLNGSGSDADGDALTYAWTGPSGSTAGATLSLSLPIGSYVFTLNVDDHNGGVASDSVVITVVDAKAPEITAVAATPSMLLQTNHTMVPVAVSASITDCDPSASCKIVSVTSNEPDDGLGDGDTANDWRITGERTLELRAERAGGGTGRIYTITIACTDAAGNTSTSTLTVTVPHDSSTTADAACAAAGRQHRLDPGRHVDEKDVRRGNGDECSITAGTEPGSLECNRLSIGRSGRAEIVGRFERQSPRLRAVPVHDPDFGVQPEILGGVGYVANQSRERDPRSLPLLHRTDPGICSASCRQGGEPRQADRNHRNKCNTHPYRARPGGRNFHQVSP